MFTALRLLLLHLSGLTSLFGQDLRTVPAFNREHCSVPALYVLDHGFINTEGESVRVRLHVFNGSPDFVFVEDRALDAYIAETLSPDGISICKGGLPRTVSSRAYQERAIHLRPGKVGKAGAPIISIGVVDIPDLGKQQLDDVRQGKIRLRVLATVRWFNAESKKWQEADTQVKLKVAKL